jgi:Spy/CpxP family protein refolding chaperone
VQNSWKVLAGALVVFAISAPAIQAQGQGQGGGQPGAMQRGGNRMVQMLLKDISLDEAQKAQIEVIKGKYEKEFPPPTQGQEPDSSSRAQRREAMMRMQGDIREVLTEEQKKTFEKNLAEMRDRMQKRGQRGGHGDGHEG